MIFLDKIWGQLKTVRFLMVAVLIIAFLMVFSGMIIPEVQAQGSCACNIYGELVTDSCWGNYHPVCDAGGTCYCAADEPAQEGGSCTCNIYGNLVTDACWANYHPVCDTGGTCYCVADEPDEYDTILTVRSQIEGDYVEGLNVQCYGGLTGTGGVTDYYYSTVDTWGIRSTILRAPETFGAAEFYQWSGCNSVADRDCTVRVNYGSEKTVVAQYQYPEPSCTLSIPQTEITTGDSIQLNVEGSHYNGVTRVCYVEDEDYYECHNCDGSTSCSYSWSRTLNQSGTYSYRGLLFSGSDYKYSAEVTVTVKEASCQFSLSTNSASTGEDVTLSLSAQHSDGVRTVYYWEDGTWYARQNPDQGEEYQTSWILNHDQPGVYKYRAGFYPVGSAGSGSFVWCPGEETLTVVQSNQLNVYSQVDGSAKEGLVVVGEPSSLNGTTNYTQSSITAINGSLTAPSSFSGANFSQWTGCDSVNGRVCTVSISDGATQTVTAQYLTPATTTNTLNVRSQVDGASQSGVAITGSPSSLGGMTNYTRTSTSTISALLMAPSSFDGANFSQWTGCSFDSGRFCIVNVSNGKTQTVTALFTSPETMTPECNMSIYPLTVSTGQSFRITVQAQHADGINGVYYYENGQYIPGTSQSCNGNQSCTVFWDISKDQPGDYQYRSVFRSVTGAWIYSDYLTVTVEESVTPATNSLWIRSQVDGSWQSGAYISRVSGPVESGETHYSYESTDAIEARLQASATLNAAQFDSWSGCTQTIGPRDCVISVSDGETKTIIANYSIPVDPANELRVRSQVDGTLTPGVVIGYDPETQDMSGTTHYDRSFQGTINTTLIAPATFGAANFSHWSGCNETDGYNCTVNVSGGSAKEVTVYYLTPNTLQVSSSVGGYLQPGLVISDLSGNDLGGTTNYSHTIDGPLSVVLEAPTKHLSANFKNWAGCDSVDGLKCIVEADGGQTKSVEVIYEYGIPEWQER